LLFIGADTMTKNRSGGQECLSWQQEYVQLFVANQRRIHAFIRSLVPHALDSEDVLQETSITGCQKFPEVAERLISSPEAFVTWACTIAKFEALKHFRKKKASQLPVTEELLEQLADRHQQQSEYLEMRYRALTHCVQKLSPKDRLLLQHRYETDARPQQIAASTGRPLNSVYKGLQRIRASLLVCIDRVIRSEGSSK
jgi:RNA polymerase sigma-70 factor (ECF subfamily)